MLAPIFPTSQLGGSSSKEGTAAPITVYKTVFDLEIPLHNSGPAGLGVTVYTKSTSLKDGGEMGVYIKSIVAGGAAAMVNERGMGHWTTIDGRGWYGM